MLGGTVAFLLVVVFALAGGELRNLLARRGHRAPAMEGLSFLVLGYLLGDQVLGLFPRDLLQDLRPVVLLGVTWIGLMFGLQIELRVISQLKPWHRALGWAAPAVVGAVVGGGAVVVGLGAHQGLVLAALATACSPATLESLTRGRGAPADRSAARLLRLVVAYSSLPAVLLFTAVTVIESPLTTAGAGGLAAPELLAFSMGVGVLVGYLSLALARGGEGHISLLTLLTGTMSMVAGASAALGTSSLPAAACAGAVIINRGTFAHRMLRVAHGLERPLLVALLVLVGASWTGVAFSWPVFGVMVGGRWLGAMLGGVLMSSVARRRGVPLRVRGLGLGLLPQGELALGLLVALEGLGIGAPGVFEAVVAAMAVHQVTGQWWLRRRLFPGPAVRAS